MTLSVIIVNYNVNDLLKNCINSFQTNVVDVDYEIIVADNNSTDRSVELIEYDYPNVKFLKLKENLGFAKANNTAAKVANGKYLLFLNPDTLVLENFVPEFLMQFNNSKMTGICAPQLVYGDNSYQSSTGPQMGLFHDILESFGLVGLYRKHVWSRHVSDTQIPIKVGWVSAACLFIEKVFFDKVSGFTESYFLNYEDIDLCFKVKELGLDIFYFPSLKCVHFDHKSFGTNWELLVYSRYAGRLKYTELHYNFFKSILSRVILVTGIILKMFFVSFAFSSQESKSRRKGYFRALKLYTGIE